MSQDSGVWSNPSHATSSTSGISSESQQLTDEFVNFYYDSKTSENVAKEDVVSEVEVTTQTSKKPVVLIQPPVIHLQQPQLPILNLTHTNKSIKFITLHTSNNNLGNQVIVGQSPSTPARIPLIKSKNPIVITPSRNVEPIQPQILSSNSNIITLISNNTPLKNYIVPGMPTTKRLYAEAVPQYDQLAGGDNVKRRKSSAHGGRGLRHFSMKVCEKVQQKGITTYNEVADELVSEFGDTVEPPQDIYDQSMTFDQKNIRRRVYDALNVLMAMNIISKEKKEIRWIGLPTNSMEEHRNLEIQKKNLMARIQNKNRELNELILMQIVYKNLVERNKERERLLGPPSHNAYIKLPFVIINTNKKTVIDCSISTDKCEYLLNFDQAFEMHDDIDVLKKMGLAFGLEMGQSDPQNLEKAASMVPTSLRPLVYGMVKQTDMQIKTEIPTDIDEQVSEEVIWDYDSLQIFNEDPSQQSSSYGNSDHLSPPEFSDPESEDD